VDKDTPAEGIHVCKHSADVVADAIFADIADADVCQEKFIYREFSTH